MLKSGLLAIFICIFSFSFSQTEAPRIPDNTLRKSKGVYYITAPNGLNLRKKDETGSDKMGKISFGDKVDLITPANSSNLEVDKISGGMAKVDFDGVIGYAFEGYLSKIPPPTPNVNAEAYVEKIRNSGQEVIFEKRTKDWGGYLQYEEAITVQVADWAEAFLIAQTLFRIPKGFKFPNVSKTGTEVIKNPKVNQYAWTDELEIKRDDKGMLIEISYNYRGEASGQYVSISIPKDVNDRGLRISNLEIAD